jgi:hypothetical protein
MVHGSGSATKKILEKTLIRRKPGDRFEGPMEREFFNGAFKRNLLIFHECPTRKGAFPVITG